ncbi:Clp protease N-terminal domain-containing protein [Streptomyces sp. NPDC057909]|uniref:Clp protease N-terminal domain-containing protein n=1 Tax=Streptomyces sp. NPDC057909 TaxID=3346277 RepID=UPI0036E50693
MFERFTADARAVVTGAVDQARRAGSRSVTEEHMLLALLDRPGGGRASFAATALGLTGRRASVEAALADAARRGGLTKADTDALAGIGIDVTEIVARIEGAHGEGALAGDRKDRRGRSGRPPFSRGAKTVLEKSLRIALGRGDRFIGQEHILLAFTVIPGVVADVLAEHGATYGTVTRALYGDGGAEGQAEAS